MNDTLWLLRIGFAYCTMTKEPSYYKSPMSKRAGPMVQLVYEPFLGCNGWKIVEPTTATSRGWYEVAIPEMQTREDVVGLCRVLGIPLKEVVG